MDRRDEPLLSPATRARLVALAGRLHARDDAEDIVQDALLDLRSRGTADLRSVEAWLHTTVRNAAFDARRRVAVERRVLARLAADAGATAAPDVDEALDVDRWIATLVATLGIRTTAALLLRVAFDASYDELADRSGRSPVAWRQLLHRALARIRRGRLAHRGLDDDETRAAAQCRSALASADPARLHALVRTTTVARAAVTGPQVAPRTGRAQPMLALVGGRYVLALVRDGVVLCALPVGTSDESVSSVD